MHIKEINTYQAVATLEKMLGKSWLEENLKIIKNGQGGRGSFGRNINFETLEIPPSAVIWYKAREEMINHEITGQEFTGSFTMCAATIGYDLEKLKDCPGFEKRIGSLKKVSDVYRTVHEIHIASAYLQNGFRISFNEINGVFTIEDEDNTSLLIICENWLEQNNQQHDVNNVFSFLNQKNTVADSIEFADLTAKTILYLHIGDMFNVADSIFHEPASIPALDIIKNNHALNTMPLVVTTSGIQTIDHLSVYIRLGRLVIDTNPLLQDRIYIPNEKLALL